MYVPAFRTSLDKGEGDALERAVFEVVFSGPSGVPTPRNVVRGTREAYWEPVTKGKGTISEEARDLMKRMEAQRYDPRDRGLHRLAFTVPAPQAGILEGATYHLAWTEGEPPRCSLTDPPSRLARHEHEAVRAFAFLLDGVMNDPLGDLNDGGYDVDRVFTERGGEALVFTHGDTGEEGDRALVVLSETGRIEDVRRRRHGVERITRYEWRDTPEGAILKRQVTENVRYGQPRVVEYIHDEPGEGIRARFRLPSRIVVSVPGILARSFEFFLHYDGMAPTER